MAQVFLVRRGMSLLAVLLVPGLILYFMTPEERQRLLRWIEGGLVRARVVVSTSRSREGDPFFTALRARRRWPVVTWTLVAVNVAVLIAMLAGPDPLGATDTLMAWGGNFGPRTTSAERWRVLSSVFVHRGVLHLLVNMIVLVQLGMILERMVGPFTFGTIYIASGVLGSVMSTVAAPMGVFVGAAGAVCGLYGLLGIAAFRGLVQSTAVRIPLRILTTLVPTAVIFCAFYLVSGDSWLTAKFGLCTGFVCGVVLTRSVADERVRLRRYAALGFATAGIVVLSALGLRAITDVRPAIAEIIAAEERTSSQYDAAVRQFTKGAINRRVLTQMIDATILPQIQESSARFDRFVDVPDEHAVLVTEAQTYLRLRQESWRTRSEALGKANMRRLREADEKEQAALQAFARLNSQ